MGETIDSSSNTKGDQGNGQRLPESFKEVFKIATGLSMFLSIRLIVCGLLASLTAQVAT